jgi:hypothetical protein
MMRLSVVMVSVTVRVVILHCHGKDVGQVAFRDFLLEVLLDVVIELVECQFVAAMVGIEKLLALLSRQVRRLRVASAGEKDKNNMKNSENRIQFIQNQVSSTLNPMLLKRLFSISLT